MGRIQITAKLRKETVLADRAGRLKPTGQPYRLDPIASAVHFLRGVSSRAALTLPAFYMFLGSRIEQSGACSVSAYPGLVLTHWVRFASISTVTLSCRKAFDQKSSGLTGGTFAKTSDSNMHGVATYWASRSGRSVDDALLALTLLRDIFRACSNNIPALLGGNTTLGKRVGLLRQHADRSAAHLSMEEYEFSIVDCAHVVAALALIGEIVRSFDDPGYSASYFNELDEGALAAAKGIFPQTPGIRLFGHINIANQALWCWKHDPATGLQHILEQLPYAIGWWAENSP
jgi:hypothetical protein